jgi:carbon storage regulator
VLTLTRKIGEEIRIGDDIVIVLKSRRGGQIRVGIEAPRSLRITRGEVYEELQEERRKANRQRWAAALDGDGGEE